MLHLTVVYQVGPVTVGKQVFSPPDLVQHITEDLCMPGLKRRRPPPPPARPSKGDKGRAATPCWHPVSVSMRAKARASGAAYYGKGAWDKIPYLLEVTGEVVLFTPPEYGMDEVRETQDIAVQLAKEGVLRHLRSFQEDLVSKVETVLFPELFND